jgi:hypothetical protein
VSANAFYVKFDCLGNGLVQIEDASGFVDFGQIDRASDKFLLVEGYREGFLDAGEVSEVQTVLFLALTGRRNIHAPLDLLSPAPKVINAARCANDPDTYLFCLLVPEVRPIEKQAILGVCGFLTISKFQRWLEQMQRLERSFREFHQGSSSGSGRPSVESSCSVPRQHL